MDLWAVQPEVERLQELAALLKESVPQPWEAPVDKVLLLCQWYYGYNGAGGWLHVVLDDGNLEDAMVDSAIRHAEDEGDIVAIMLGLLIRTMTEDNREVLYDSLHGRVLQ